MFIVRHGESQFNRAFKKNRQDPGIIDPELTTLGIQQIKKNGVILSQQKYKEVYIQPLPAGNTNNYRIIRSQKHETSYKPPSRRTVWVFL